METFTSAPVPLPEASPSSPERAEPAAAAPRSGRRIALVVAVAVAAVAAGGFAGGRVSTRQRIDDASDARDRAERLVHDLRAERADQRRDVLVLSVARTALTAKLDKAGQEKVALEAKVASAQDRLAAMADCIAPVDAAVEAADAWDILFDIMMNTPDVPLDEVDRATEDAAAEAVLTLQTESAVLRSGVDDCRAALAVSCASSLVHVSSGTDGC